MKMDTEVVIVGAGFAGLSAAAVLAKRGKKVLLFEASNELGGCAGKFDRKEYRFAAGATVGMGFEPAGLFDLLYRELAITPPLMQDLPIIMDVHLPDRKLRYWQNKQLWYQELAQHFPHDHQQIQAFYEEVFQVASVMQPFIQAKPMFPPQTIHDYMKLASLVRPQLLRLIPYAFEPVQSRLRYHGIAQHRAFICFLNGQLMDSVQTTVEYSPTLLAYLALNVFHQGAFYVYGGLATIAQQLAEVVIQHGGQIFMRNPVTQVKSRGVDWQVTTAKEQTYTAKHVIFANSLHNLEGILDSSLSKKLPKRMKQEHNLSTWGAFTMYFAVKDTFLPVENPSPLFHQMIQDYDKPLSEGNQFLFSISAKDDGVRAPQGYRTVTVSTHTAVEPWWHRPDYDSLKESYTLRIVNAIAHRFPDFPSAIEMQLPGTPVTFYRYTKRHKGKVGGYVHKGPFSLIQSFSPRLPVQGLWACGDTVFPGAGTLGTAMSGWTVANQICETDT
jgi:C-3',4' desaturase CrtD